MICGGGGMDFAATILTRICAVCALGAFMDVFVEGSRQKSGVRLIGSLLLILSMMDLCTEVLNVVGWPP